MSIEIQKAQVNESAKEQSSSPSPSPSQKESRTDLADSKLTSSNSLSREVELRLMSEERSKNLQELDKDISYKEEIGMEFDRNVFKSKMHSIVNSVNHEGRWALNADNIYKLIDENGNITSNMEDLQSGLKTLVDATMFYDSKGRQMMMDRGITDILKEVRNSIGDENSAELDYLEKFYTQGLEVNEQNNMRNSILKEKAIEALETLDELANSELKKEIRPILNELYENFEKAFSEFSDMSIAQKAKRFMILKNDTEKLIELNNSIFPLDGTVLCEQGFMDIFLREFKERFMNPLGTAKESTDDFKDIIKKAMGI